MSNIIYEDRDYTVVEDDEEKISVIDKHTEFCIDIMYSDNVEFKNSLNAGIDIGYIVKHLLCYDNSDWY